MFPLFYQRTKALCVPPPQDFSQRLLLWRDDGPRPPSSILFSPNLNEELEAPGLHPPLFFLKFVLYFFEFAERALTLNPKAQLPAGREFPVLPSHSIGTFPMLLIVWRPSKKVLLACKRTELLLQEFILVLFFASTFFFFFVVTPPSGRDFSMSVVFFSPGSPPHFFPFPAFPSH